MRVRLVALTLALCVGGSLDAAPLSAQRTAPVAIRPLTAAEQLTLARLLRMTDARVFDAVVVRAALASSAAPLRRYAATALGQLGPARSDSTLPLLRTLARDADTATAARAAFGLGLLRDSASVRQLAELARTGKGPFAEAAWALGAIGAPARDAITALLDERALAGSAPVQLLLASAKLAPLPIQAVSPYLASADRAVVWAAAYALARSRSSDGMRALLALPVSQLSAVTRGGMSSAPYANIESAGASVPAEVARGLAKTPAGESLADSAIAMLLLLSRDRDPHVRINAVRALGTYTRASPAVLALAERDPDANVRIAAAQSLGGSAYSDSAWARLLAADTALAFRAALLGSAARTRQLRDALEEYRRVGGWEARAAAYGAAANIPDSAAVRQFARSGLADTDARVREVALATFVGTDTTLRDTASRVAVNRALRDTDPIVRATALSALATRADVNAVTTALDAYALARGDLLADARLASIALIAAAWRSDSASFSPRLLATLRSLPPDTAYVARLAARSVTPLARWRSVVPRTRPIAWYASVVRDQFLPSLAGRLPIARIRTSRGTIVIALEGAEAPLTVRNFTSLARAGFYRGTRFHRVVPNFVAQDGDPRGDGNGGPSYAIRDELNTLRYQRAAVGMALSGPDTGGSQYFLTLSAQPHLDGRYTIFGKVVGGLDVMDRLVQGDPIESVSIQ